MAVAGTPLPPVVDKGLVGLGHAVRIVPLLDRRSLLAVGVHDLRRQTLGHGATGAAPGCSQEPAHGQRHLACGTHFQRDLVGGAAYAPRPHLQHRHRVPHRLLEHLARVFLDALAHLVQRIVDDALGDALLAVLHHFVNYRLHPDATVLGVGRCRMANDFAASWHWRLRSLSRPFGLARAVLAALLLSTLNATGVQRAPDDVIAHARQVSHAAAPDQDHRVLLQGVALAGDVGGDLYAIGEADAGHLAQGGVGLLGRLSAHVGADATLLRVAFAAQRPIRESVVTETQGRRLRLLDERLPS